MEVGNDYIFVGTVLGLRDCRSRWMRIFPEDANTAMQVPQPNRIIRFFRRSDKAMKVRGLFSRFQYA